MTTIPNITKIEKGWIDDDFIHDRISLKVYTIDGKFVPCKAYRTGLICQFYRSHNPYEYEERSLDPIFIEAIKSHPDFISTKFDGI